jgi:hypothetical protein
MTKDEARRTKEGRMTKVEGKGGSDFGLCDSFVLRASSFGISLSGFIRPSSFVLRHFIFLPPKKLPGKIQLKKPCFLREKRPSDFTVLRKPRKQAKNHLESVGIIRKKLENRDFLFDFSELPIRGPGKRKTRWRAKPALQQKTRSREVFGAKKHVFFEKNGNAKFADL